MAEPSSPATAIARTKRTRPWLRQLVAVPALLGAAVMVPLEPRFLFVFIAAFGSVLVVQDALNKKRRHELFEGREALELHLAVQQLLEIRWLPPQAAREAWIDVASALGLDPGLMRPMDSLNDLLAREDQFKVEAMYVRRYGGTPPEKIESVADAVELMVAFKRAMTSSGPPISP